MTIGESGKAALFSGVAVVAVLFVSAIPAAAQGPLNFAFTGSNRATFGSPQQIENYANGAPLGQSGVDLLTFTAAASGGVLGTDTASKGNSGLGVGANTLINGTEILSIKKGTASSLSFLTFRDGGLVLTTGASASDQFRVEGFSNGVSVGSATGTVGSFTNSAFAINFGAQFDEIQLSALNGMGSFGVQRGSFNATPVPEPGAMAFGAVSGLGLTGLVVRGRRRSKAALLASA